MNNKITLPALVEVLSSATACSRETAADFVKATFDTISSAISRGETVTVKGLGVFMALDDGQIMWRPDEELASAVNEPFEFFEAVELEEGVTPETLEGNVEDSAGPDLSEIPVAPVMPEPVEESADEPVEDVMGPVAEEPEKEDAESMESSAVEEDAPVVAVGFVSEPVVEPEVEPEPEYVPEYEDGNPEDSSGSRRRCRFHPCVTFVVGLLLGLLLGYFGAIYAGSRIREIITGPSDVESGEIVVVDSGLPADTLPADTVPQSVADSVGPEPASVAVPETGPLATDTVRSNRYLTTMSRKYYGDYRFWVYIYEENSSVIADPDRISPGTAVVIPRPEKYGIDADSRESLAAAERKSMEIAAKKAK